MFRITKRLRDQICVGVLTALTIFSVGLMTDLTDAFAAGPSDALGGNSPEAMAGWPLRLETEDGLITVYQPQVSKLDGDKLSARAAVSVVKKGGTDPIFGAVWFDSRVSTDRVARTVQILNIAVTKTHFPEAVDDPDKSLPTSIGETLSQHPMTLSLDQLLTSLEVIEKEKAAVKEITTDAPKIIFATHRAILVQYDGAPRLSEPMQGSGLLRVVNTPFFVVLDQASKTYFLRGAGHWFAAPDARGPFAPIAQAPKAVSDLADASGYNDPEQAMTDAQAAGLEIVTAIEPTELIWTDGPEELGTIPGTDLLYVTNTESDVFLTVGTQQFLVLLSGRWYTAPNRQGPWTYVPPDQLPEDMKKIPPGSDKGEVLAHIAGTPEAKDAVADTFVPQTAAVDRQQFEAPPVQYDGEPKFERVENTPQVTYAVNTPQSVLLVNGWYYCCYNGVWYVSPRPNGPWGLCTQVPLEIYTIPPSCPVYAVRYCYVYEVTPRFVYCGYTPGYVGCYPHRGVVVYGTGYHYRPWEGRIYCPRPYTYGFAARYDSYNGAWGFSIGSNVGGGSAWFGRRDDRFDDHDRWFGQGGYRPVYSRTTLNINVRDRDDRRDDHRDDRRDIRREDPPRRADFNLYERRHDVQRVSAPAHGDDRFQRDAKGNIERDSRGRGIPTDVKPGVARPGDVKPGEVRPGDVRPGVARPGDVKPGEVRPSRTATTERERNNVLAAPNGDVYRRTTDGWEERDKGKWVPRKGTAAEREPAPRPNTAVPQNPAAKPAPASPAPRPTPATTPRETTPPRETKPPRETTPAPRETPRETAPAPKPREPDRPTTTTPPVKSPPTVAPAPRTADRDDNQGDLNRDYRARIAAEQRSRANADRAPSRGTDDSPRPARPSEARPGNDAPRGGGDSPRPSGAGGGPTRGGDGKGDPKR
jgi:hypothetical protein